MEKFELLKGIAAPLPMMNVDTDMIIPKQFLKTIKRSGLGKNLFHELRFDMQGNIKNDFVLNWDPYKEASILIAGDNFGCGSSREHAVWALRDFGFKAVIASSFGDIFYNNCFKNSVLPIVLTKEEINNLFEICSTSPTSFEIDLVKKNIKFDGEFSYSFNVKDSLLDRIINNLDDVDITLKHKYHIEAFEQTRRNQRPWLFDYSN